MPLTPQLWQKYKPVSKLIEKDGNIFIEVPNIETSKASPNNIYFRAHIHYFSEATLVASASQYFEKIYSERDSNLRIIFRKKEVKEDLILPSSKQVFHTRNRLNSKGWIEYLLKGKGYQKFFSKIKQAFIESSLHNKDSLSLLTELIEH